MKKLQAKRVTPIMHGSRTIPPQWFTVAVAEDNESFPNVTAAYPPNEYDFRTVNDRNEVVG